MERSKKEKNLVKSLKVAKACTDTSGQRSVGGIFQFLGKLLTFTLPQNHETSTNCDPSVPHSILLFQRMISCDSYQRDPSSANYYKCLDFFMCVCMFGVFSPRRILQFKKKKKEEARVVSSGQKILKLPKRQEMQHLPTEDHPI